MMEAHVRGELHRICDGLLCARCGTGCCREASSVGTLVAPIVVVRLLIVILRRRPQKSSPKPRGWLLSWLTHFVVVCVVVLGERGTRVCAAVKLHRALVARKGRARALLGHLSSAAAGPWAGWCPGSAGPKSYVESSR